MNILVNTCDAFEDCWNPFFKLFSKYWPDFEGKIYLNTETKSYSYPGLEIHCVQNSLNESRRLTWSECMLEALQMMDGDYFLYFQEDYFLKNYVNTKEVEYFKTQFVKNNLDCLHLTDQAGKPDLNVTIGSYIHPIQYNSNYLVSCQVAFWKKNTFIKYLRRHETAWNFEMFGSMRARIYKDKIMIINPDKTAKDLNEIIPYIFTGIIGGKWYREVIPLFRDNQINIDYSTRGFHGKEKLPLIQNVKRKIRNTPNKIKSTIDLSSTMLDAIFIK